MARPGPIELPTAIFGEIEYLIKSSRQGSDRRLIEWPPSCSTERMTPISHQHLWSSNAVWSVSSSSRVSRLAEEITFWMTKVVPCAVLTERVSGSILPQLMGSSGKAAQTG
jgi:hypothetical protein